MASILRVNTLTDASSNNSTAMSTINQGTAKAWVNFDGTGTISARDSFNTASLTDNGTGDYSINYSTAMGNANYSVCALGSNNRWVYYQNSGHTTGLCKVFTKDATPNNAYDAGHVMIQVLGDLA